MDGRDVAQFGSALDWGSRGRRFKSGRPDCFSNTLGTNWEPNGNDHGRPTQGMGCGLRACAGALLPLTPPVTPPRGRCRRPRCRQEAPGSGGVDGRRRRYCVAESVCIRGNQAAPAPASAFGEARPARAGHTRRSRRSEQLSVRRPGAARSRLPRLLIVQLAATASNAPCGRRCAIGIRRHLTRRPLARILAPTSKTGQSSQPGSGWLQVLPGSVSRCVGWPG